MVKQSSGLGFTLIELAVVLSVIGLVAAVAIYGLAGFKNTDPVTNAQRELVVNLRSVQNKINNGGDGVSVKSVDFSVCATEPCSYVLGGMTVSLPSGVTIPTLSASGVNSPLSICFVNPNLSKLDGYTCGSSNACTSGVGYLCDRSGPGVLSQPASLTITFQKGTFQKTVVVEGAGMKINRIYAP